MVRLLCLPRFCFLCRCSRFRDVPWSTQLLTGSSSALGVWVRLFSLPCTDGCVGPFRVPPHKAPGQQHTIWLLLLFLALVAFFGRHAFHSIASIMMSTFVRNFWWCRRR